MDAQWHEDAQREIAAALEAGEFGLAVELQAFAMGRRCVGPCGRLLPADTEHFPRVVPALPEIQEECRDCRLKRRQREADARRHEADRLLRVDREREASCFLAGDIRSRDGLCNVEFCGGRVGEGLHARVCEECSARFQRRRAPLFPIEMVVEFSSHRRSLVLPGNQGVYGAQKEIDLAYDRFKAARGIREMPSAHGQNVSPARGAESSNETKGIARSPLLHRLPRSTRIDGSKLEVA